MNDSPLPVVAMLTGALIGIMLLFMIVDWSRAIAKWWHRLEEWSETVRVAEANGRYRRAHRFDPPRGTLTLL